MKNGKHVEEKDGYSKFSFESLRRLLLGREYFDELILPLLKKEFQKYEKEVVALDLGSASFGASDKDSDFDGFIVLTDALWMEIGGTLSQKLANLPSWRWGTQEIRFLVGRYGNFGFGDFFIDHSLDKWYRLPLSTHWHVQHYYRYYDPKRDFYRFQEEISEIPIQYLQHRAAGHFFQLFNHRRAMENAILKDDKVAFYIDLGEAFFHSLCLPFFANRETTPLWRWLLSVSKRSKTITISELAKKLEDLSTSIDPQRATDLFREHQEEIASSFRNLDLLPQRWLAAPFQIPPEHQNPRQSPHLTAKISKSTEKTEQRRQLWASWYKLSALAFWFSKIIKRRDFCAGYIAIGRALANARNIAKILSGPLGEDIAGCLAKSTIEIERTQKWQERRRILAVLQKNIAERLKETNRIPIRYLKDPIALMAEDLDLGL